LSGRKFRSIADVDGARANTVGGSNPAGHIAAVAGIAAGISDAEAGMEG
jgi:hypothetical protein